MRTFFAAPWGRDSRGFERFRSDAVSGNAAAAEGRPVQYLERATDKEELVQKIRADQGATERGWIAVFRTLENCISYDIFRNRQTPRIDWPKHLDRLLRGGDPRHAQWCAAYPQSY